MWKVFEGAYTDKQFRDGADFVPYSTEELKEIADIDAKSREEWTPPPEVHPHFFELCDQFRDESDVPLNPPENVVDVDAEIPLATDSPSIPEPEVIPQADASAT